MKEFIFPIHVFIEDTDFTGVVYHANFLKYMERGRSSLAEKSGFGLDQLAKQKIYFVIRNVTIDYLSPGRLHDDLEVVTTIEKVGHTSLTFKQIIRFAKQPDKILSSASVVGVCVDENLKPRELPKQLMGNIDAN